MATYGFATIYLFFMEYKWLVEMFWNFPHCFRSASLGPMACTHSDIVPITCNIKISDAFICSFMIFVLVGSYIYIKRHQRFCWDFDWSDLPDSQKRSSQRGIEINWKFVVTYWMGESSFCWLNNISLFNWEGVFFI